MGTQDIETIRARLEWLHKKRAALEAESETEGKSVCWYAALLRQNEAQREFDRHAEEGVAALLAKIDSFQENDAYVCGAEEQRETDLEEISALRAENEQLRERLASLAEAGTGYSQQTMDALVKERDALQKEVEALRERLMLTPERVEAAAAAAYMNDTCCRFDAATPDERNDYMETAMVTLRAAGMEEKA